MIKTRTLMSCVKGDCFLYALRIVIALIIMTPIVVSAAIGCARRIILVHTIYYGGQMYNSYISCGSSAGNFGYTCGKLELVMKIKI